jgi:transcription elongation GreA/GreB family factor
VCCNGLAGGTGTDSLAFTEAAKADQEINEARIVDLEDTLARAEVIDVS